jgi:O-antigen ligase
MAVHTVGAIAFIVLATTLVAGVRDLAVRATVALPLTWTIFATGTTNRGSLVTSTLGLALIAVLARRSRNWQPIGIAALALVVLLTIPGLIPAPGPEPGETPFPTATPTVPSPTPTGSPGPTPEPTPTPAQPEGRDTTIGQFIDNLVSIFVSSARAGLEGTRQFRLQWWGTIVEYTVFGPHFWTGKGFGVNLADDDGFQPTADRSLRAPHNSHMTVLARMGVPGFLLWLVLQLVFAVSLLRAILAHRRSGEVLLAAVGGILAAWWLGAMLNTSFDPYLEGPQGGIWFWTIFGLGLVVIRLASRPVIARRGNVAAT